MGGLALGLTLSAARVVCGDEKRETGGSTAADAQASTPTKILGDCAYAKQITDDLGRFATSLPDTSAASIGDADQAVQNLNTLDADLGALVARMKDYPLAGDVAKVNTAFIGFFEDFRTQIPAVRAAAQLGDAFELDRFSVVFGEDLDVKLEKI